MSDLGSKHWRPRLGAALLLVLATISSASADPIDDYLRQEMDRRRIPGLAYAVVDGERVARTGYLGLANVELRVPVDEGSVFAIASLDKQLTAAGVMKLVEMGKLALDDDPGKLLELPWPGLRVRELLSHTSGLPDEVAFAIQGRGLSDYSTQELLDHVRGLTPLAPPGVRYHYSDANFFLAQLLTEKVSGEPWRAFMQREVFAPAGMRAVVGLDPATIVAGRVAAYRLDRQGNLLRDGRQEADYGPLYNDLGMTVGDFARWLLALGTATPLSRASLEAMWAPLRLADGRVSNDVFQWPGYGLGFGLDQFAGHRVVVHSGSSGVGFFYLPDSRFGVVVLTNLRHASGSDPVGLALGIAGLVRPQLDLSALPVDPGADPALTARARALYASMLAGTPDLDLVALPERTAFWEGADGLAGRSSRFGELEIFEAVRAPAAAPGGVHWFRARHRAARVILRIGYDDSGKVRTLAWSHL